MSVERWNYVQAPSRKALEEDLYATGGETYIKGEDPDHEDGHSFDVVDIEQVPKKKPQQKATLERIITREVLGEHADEYDEYETERKGQE